MTRVMIVLGSVRPGRIGLPIAEWVRSQVEEHTDWEVDWADLAEIALPFMDEPNHPILHEYTQPHTIAWAERVEAADGFLFVTPEYNHSYSPVLKNALDYLHSEWWRKPVGFVSYGGVSGGTRGVASLGTVILGLGMVRTGASVELPFARLQIADGVFTPTSKESAVLLSQFGEIEQLATAMRPLQNR